MTHNDRLKLETTILVFENKICDRLCMKLLQSFVCKDTDFL